MAENLAVAFGGSTIRDPSYYTDQPAKVTGKEAAKFLLGKKNVMILTGAGISAASGIPTFRGDNGFWSKSYGEETDPMKILTLSYFSENPKLNW